ncbi:MAG: hypothetical protein ACI9WU_001414 [Myxococcota bacterium]
MVLKTAILTSFLAAVLAAGCGASIPTVPTPDPVTDADRAAEDARDQAEAEKRARAFVATKLARDWGAIWDMTAQVHRDLVLSVGKQPAEGDEATAKAQGFASAAEVKGMSGRDWFVRRRTLLAEQNMSVYTAGATPAQFDVRAPIMVPFPGQRIRVVPVHVTMSDGFVDKLAATREGDHWSMLEK